VTAADEDLQPAANAKAAATRKRPIGLDDPIRYLKGVGPRRAELFARLGILTVRDLIEHFPSRYEKYGPAVPVANLAIGEVQTVVGRVLNVRSAGFGRTGRVVASVADNTGRMVATWFGSPWMLERLKPGLWVRLRGKVRQFAGFAQMVNPQTDLLEEPIPAEAAAQERLVPVYPACEGLTSRQIAKLVAVAWQQASEQVQEFYDRQWRRRRDLLPRQLAIQWMHWPQQAWQIAQARRRLAYDELLIMQLAVAIRRWYVREGRRAPNMPLTAEIDRRIRRRFPFRFTAGQNRAAAEIASDMARTVPMNRLLQGDVGSGKTAVALYASLLAVAHRWQVAILAPTEILAEQHYERICRYLAGSRVRHGLLTGSTARRLRANLLRAAACGELDILVGTHALLEEDVEFARLGLVIVDEQHRFGVRQRAMMRGKGYAPHYLVMTATPIPRTLAMTVFGDLDVSIIDDMPPGRQPVRTRLIPAHREAEAFKFVEERLRLGEQAFVVYPLVSESENLPLKAATAEVKRLKEQYLKDWPIGLIHGKMSAAEKHKTMSDFAAGRIAVLVATTVIEVGIDVPNATVMVVQHAERYGLAQLHQLRGRVGRGNKPGHCLLIPETDAEQALARLRILCDTNDGFAIAEADLKMRGPGQIVGLRQHGLPELKVADLIADANLLKAARQDATSLIRTDPRLTRPEHAALRAELARRVGQVLPLIDMA